MKEEKIKIIVPHFVKSSEVKESDVKEISEIIVPMAELCENMETLRKVKDAYALAHCQITDKNPLRFFVFNIYNQGVVDIIGDLSPVIVNPVIIRHTYVPVTKREGCLSLNEFGGNEVFRYNKIVVEFQELKEEKGEYYLSEKIKLDCSGKLSQIFQHEIDHFNAKYIFDNDMIETMIGVLTKK